MASVPLIALVGMPGSGKSTVGRHLARSLGSAFVDLDATLERSLGVSIRSFFEAQGEEAFRDREEAELAALGARQAGAPSFCVLATGGGIVLRASNRRMLRGHATVVYLHATPEDLFRRLRHDTQRPLLQVADPLRRLRELYQLRDPLYRDAADYVIETGRPSVAKLVAMVRMQLELAGLVSAHAGPAPRAAEGERQRDESGQTACP